MAEPDWSLLEKIHLEKGKHEDCKGYCAIEALRACLYLFPDDTTPPGASHMLCMVIRTANDFLDDAERQTLKAILPLVPGSARHTDVLCAALVAEIRESWTAFYATKDMRLRNLIVADRPLLDVEACDLAAHLPTCALMPTISRLTQVLREAASAEAVP